MRIEQNEKKLIVLADKEGQVLAFARPIIESDGRGVPPTEATILPLPGQVVYEITVSDEIYAIGSIAELEYRYKLVVSGEKARFKKKVSEGIPKTK